MKTPALLLLGSLFLAGCVAANKEKTSLVGTWRDPARGYFLRVYPNGNAAIWPTPPDGHVTRTRVVGDALLLGHTAPLRDPTLIRQGDMLMMENGQSVALLKRIPKNENPPR